MRFRVQYETGPTLEIEVPEKADVNDVGWYAERAWDGYKVQTGLRRKAGDAPPTVEVVNVAPEVVGSDAGSASFQKR